LLLFLFLFLLQSSCSSHTARTSRSSKNRMDILVLLMVGAFWGNIVTWQLSHGWIKVSFIHDPIIMSNKLNYLPMTIVVFVQWFRLCPIWLSYFHSANVKHSRARLGCVGQCTDPVQNLQGWQRRLFAYISLRSMCQLTMTAPPFFNSGRHGRRSRTCLPSPPKCAACHPELTRRAEARCRRRTFLSRIQSLIGSYYDCLWAD
jgi:hypothetical protein